MYCKYCGTKLSEETKFCPTCGKLVNQVEVFPDEIQAEPIDPMEEQAKSSLGKKILTNTIVGLVLAMFTFTIMISLVSIFVELGRYGVATLMALLAVGVNILGLCLTGKARKNVNKYVVLYGATNGRASVGKALSIPSNILNIIGIVLNSILLFASFSMIGY